MGDEQVDLTQLRRRTNSAVRVAYQAHLEDRRVFAEAINWGNLRCHAAESVTREDGSQYFQVRIRKVSPNCPKFRQFIREQLADLGEIDVNTEW